MNIQNFDKNQKQKCFSKEQSWIFKHIPKINRQTKQAHIHDAKLNKHKSRVWTKMKLQQFYPK